MATVPEGFSLGLDPVLITECAHMHTQTHTHTHTHTSSQKARRESAVTRLVLGITSNFNFLL